MVTAVGCSEEQKREYTLPTSLCGVSVPTSALSQLLPVGKRLTVDEATPVPDALTTCEASVDGDMVLSLEQEHRDVGASAYDIARDRFGVKQPKSAQQRSVAYSDRVAVSVVKCRGGESGDEDITVAVKVLKPAHQNESAMKYLILGYTSAFKKQQPCGKSS